MLLVLLDCSNRLHWFESVSQGVRFAQQRQLGGEEGRGGGQGAPSGSQVGWLLRILINDSIVDVSYEAVVV